MIKILIVDDHFLIREGFKNIISNEVDMTIAGEAENAAEALKLIRETEFDVLALDISMPDRTGLDLMKDIQKLKPESKILILSMHPEDRFALRAIKSGAHGYITKESAPQEMVKAIRKVMEGRKYISETLGEKLAAEFTVENQKMPHESLSDREFQVMCKIGEGKTVTQIAEELSLSISTVNTYRIRILEKLNVNSNASLIHYVVKNNLIE